jgi:hypothetical protein
MCTHILLFTAICQQFAADDDHAPHLLPPTNHYPLSHIRSDMPVIFLFFV